jgi:hypothetical protein
MNGTMTITDAPPHAGTTAHILIDATATNKLVSVITFASPAQIKSASAIPANPFIVKIYKTTGPELRIIDLDYYTLKGVRPYIGNELIGAYCNDASNVDSVWIDSVDPLERDTQMLEHVILGRDHSRIYRIGDKAGVCVVTGHCTWDSQFPALVRDIKASGPRISIVWDRVILPYCRIEGTPKINHKRGSLRIDYSLTLVEDW